jgi:hypothetical protein
MALGGDGGCLKHEGVGIIKLKTETFKESEVSFILVMIVKETLQLLE